MKPIIITTGEPAGIGPDVSLTVAAMGAPVVLCGNGELLNMRAKLLNLDVELEEYAFGRDFRFTPGKVFVISCELKANVVPGVLNKANSPYVIEHILKAAEWVLQGHFRALLTAPVHKAIINQAGIAFSGHTELLADFFKVPQVVMMLAGPKLKVALVTNHLPLKDVPNAISTEKICKVLTILKQGLKKDFSLETPKIFVTGLNPHAGEDGVLGSEEEEIIRPAIKAFNDSNVVGPFPADTLFTPPFLDKADAFLAMYHDQGLAVLKALSFGQSVNITLGLPITRLSVDHGTALELAGTGLAKADSLKYALHLLGHSYTPDPW